MYVLNGVVCYLKGNHLTFILYVRWTVRILCVCRFIIKLYFVIQVTHSLLLYT